MTQQPNAPKNQSPDNLREYGREIAIGELLKLRYAQKKSEVHRTSLNTSATQQSIASGFIALAACFIIAAVSAWFLFFKPPSPPQANLAQITILSSSGDVSIISQLGELKSPSNGDTLTTGDTVQTKKSSFVKLSYSDGTELIVNELSDVSFKNIQSESKRLTLKKGSLSLDVAPQPEGKPFIIKTPYAKAEVIGTKLSLEVKKRHTEMSVSEGTVAFQSNDHDKVFYIREGQISALGPKVKKVEMHDPSPPRILDFTLVSVATGEPIAGYDPISDGAKIAMEELPSTGINIRINTTGRIKVIDCYSPNRKVRHERFPPYSIAGDDLQHNGKYGKLHIKPGVNQFKAIPYTMEGSILKHEIKHLTVTFE